MVPFHKGVNKFKKGDPQGSNKTPMTALYKWFNDATVPADELNTSWQD